MKRISLLSSAITLLTLTSFSQVPNIGIKGHELSKADVNFMDVARYEQEHPKPLKKKAFFEEEEENDKRPVRPDVDPSKVFLYQPPVASHSNDRMAFLPVSPAPNDTFKSTLSDGTSIPPDTHGAVDSYYCVTAINPDVHIQTRTGTNISSVTTDAFWASVLPGGPGSFDPRVHYDPYSHRWIMACLAYGETAQSQLMIGVSATNNPTGTWHLYNVLIDATGTNWLDFDNIGFNKNWIVLTGNLFNIASGSSPGAQVYVFDKANLLAGTGAPYTMFNENSAFCICPALTYDSAESSLYMLEVYNESRGQLQEWEITGTASTPVVTALGNPASPVNWSFSSYANSANAGADFAPQLGTTNLIQTNDDRINNCVERNGSLWCSHNVFLPYSRTADPTRCSIMWWQIDTGGTVLQNGLIDDPTNANFYAFPNIAVNSTNDALIGCSWFSAATYPNCQYYLHMHTDPSDSIRPGYTFRHGQANYFENFGGPKNRWGDYSATCVDPINDQDFWTLQECVPTTPANYWDTWWAYVQVCPIPTAPGLAIEPPTACIGSTNLFAASSPGATSFTWSVTGSGWSGSSTSDSINIVTGTGIATITVNGSSACGTGPVSTFTVQAATLPPYPTVGAIVPPCVGAATSTYSAAATFATSYVWSITGAGWSGASTTNNITFTDGTGSATVTCIATNACGNSPIATLVITPENAPALATSVNVPNPLCSGTTIKISTNPIPTATSYSWTITGSGWSGSGATDTCTVTVGTGPAVITVTGINGCGTGSPFTYTTNSPVSTPPVSYSVLNLVTHMAVYDTFTFTGSYIPGLYYVWNFGAASVPDSAVGIGPEKVLWTVSGLKTITITVRDSGCAVTYSDTVLVLNDVAVPNVTASKSVFNIIPNPSNGKFDIVFNQATTQPFDLKIFDMSGKMVYSQHITSLNSKIYTVITDKLSPGNYNMNIYSEGEIYSGKITIEN